MGLAIMFLVGAGIIAIAAMTIWAMYEMQKK